MHTNTSIEQIRQLYAEVIMSLNAAERSEEALECARLAVKHGIWQEPTQRPVHYLPYLPARPTYDPQQFWLTGYLEEHCPTIKAEVDALLGSQVEGFKPVTGALLGEGRWDEVIFYEYGQKFARAAKLLPNTSTILSNLPAEILNAGIVVLSCLQPKTHILPHCGSSNALLRVHLGIRTTGQAKIRVRDEILVWKESKCIVFDDSFEHEVWHRGNEPRIVLIVDMFHPALTAADRAALISSHPLSQSQVEKTRELMKGREFRRIACNMDGSISVELTESMTHFLKRIMSDNDIRSFDLLPTGALEITHK